MTGFAKKFEKYGAHTIKYASHIYSALPVYPRSVASTASPTMVL